MSNEDKLKKVVARAQVALAKAEATLAAFQGEVAKDPAFAVRHQAGAALEAAATKTVMARFLAMAARHPDLFEEHASIARADLLQRACDSSRSTSATANMLERAELSACAYLAGAFDAVSDNSK